MTTSQKSLSSGPKTEAGKAVASQNARKDSLFVKAYLPHEDAASQQALFAQLRAQWHATIQAAWFFCDRLSRRN